jgi:hypothetical protein
MKMQKIQLQGSYFKSSFSVYVVEIKNKQFGRLFYVGQTGDAKHFTARSPFYRMGGHFEYSTSTQNQIFKGVSKKLGLAQASDNREIRKKVEAFLLASEVNYYVFPVKEFSYDNEDKSKHNSKRRVTLVIETFLLKRFSEIYGDALLNKSLVTFSRTPDQEELKMIDSIIQELEGVDISLANKMEKLHEL